MINWSWPDWRIEGDQQSWSLTAVDGERLLSWSVGLPLLPRTGNGLAALQNIEAREIDAQTLELTARVSGLPEISEVRLRLVRKSDHLELQAFFTAASDGALFAWEVLPSGAKLELYRVHHIRNRHGSPRVVERYNLAGELTGGELGEGGRYGGFRISTDSTDYQFAPNPSYFVFEKNELNLFVGAKDIPQGFGLVLEAEDYLVKRCYFDYGQGIFQFRKGEVISSPVLCLFVNRDRDYWDTVDQWVDILVSEKQIADPASHTFSEAMYRPYLGPWIDQVYFGRVEGDTGMVWNWGGESEERCRKIEAVCSEQFIRAEVERMEQYGLPFGTIGIDDRWFRWRGDYELHEGRFPDMRLLVDWLHGKGLKVLLWFPPFDVEPEAQMNLKSEWLAGHGAKTKHGQAFLDYSNPAVQEEWLLPKLRLWLSDEPGCWNADGFKLDFMADKIPRNIPVHDRAWQGEEMFIWRWHKLVYETMKAIKPDSILLGCSAHPHLAQFQDWVRTFDVMDNDFRQHATRGLRIRHLTPGTMLSYDYHIDRTRFQAYLEQAIADQAHIEIGALFGMDEEIGEAELRLIKSYLDKCRPVPALRQSPADEAKFRQWTYL